MKINKLTIRNFGPISAVNFEGKGSPCIGLTDANGAGKSHVFAALQYCLTGSLVKDGGTAESYIKHGTAAAEVNCEFAKGSHSVSVTRRITPSSTSRSLTVKGGDYGDGQTFKSDKDVTRVMTDVLGVSLDAIDACVFLQQGHFTDVLYGAWASREALLSSFLMQEDYSVVVKSAGSLVKELEADIRDFQPSIDAETSHFVTLKRDLEEAEKATPVDVRAMLPQLRQRLQDVTTLRNTEARLVTLTTSRIESLLARQGVDVSKLREELTTANATLAATQEDRLNAINEIGKWTGIQQDLSNMETATANIAAAKASRDELWRAGGFENPPGNLQEIITTATSELQAVQNNLRAAEYYETLSAKRATTQANSTIWVGDITKYEALLELANTALREFDAANISITETRAAHRLGTNLRNANIGVACVCPTCLQNIPDAASIIARLSELSRLITEYDTQRNLLSRAIQEADRTLTNTRAALTVATDALLVIDKTLAELEVPTQSAEWFQAEASRLSAQLQQRQGLLNALAPVQARIDQWEAYLPTIRQHPGVIRLTQATDTLAAYTASQVPLALQVQNLQGAIQVLNGQIDKHTKAQETLVKLDGQIAAAKALVVSLSHVANVDYTDASNAVNTVEHQVTAYMKYYGKLEAMRVQLAGSDLRISELKENQQAADLKRVAITALKVVGNVFDKKGLQAKWLAYRFGEITESVNTVLNSMHAGFNVRVSETVALSYEYMSGDAQEAGWNPMNKLSGGQRVRLTIAFMLALQYTVLRNVGLLILDEPSTHVDTTGKESIAAMFQGMQEMLLRESITLLICDHDPLMELAFNEKIIIEK